jgi:toxin ParE1/3/4
MPKPVCPRALARRDVDETLAYYLDEIGSESALGFLAALERAYRHIGRHPQSGSPRYAVRSGC